MAVLFESVRNRSRTFNYPSPSVAALEAVLIRLYLESPLGAPPSNTSQMDIEDQPTLISFRDRDELRKFSRLGLVTFCTMSSLRNSLHRRNHKERSQLAHRSKLGLLEKHKDYVLRARDYHSKRERITNLRRKAADKNKDEFYFGMVNQRTEVCRLTQMVSYAC